MRALILCLLMLSGCSQIDFDAADHLGLHDQYDVTIERDRWGVPHVHGVSDADMAFGFAYAQAEDGWELIEDTIPFYRGNSARFAGQDSAPADYLIQWLDVKGWIESGYETQLSSKTKALVKAYADGLNYFAAKHPERIKKAVLPITTEDIVAGFAVRHLLFYGFDQSVKEVMGPERVREVSKLVASLGLEDTPIGSNAIAVAPPATEDGSTRLIINSHQPTDGPVAWYEAHISSDEGLDIMGGTFPGSPLISLGFNDELAWGVTVNKPDLVDIYVLDVNPDNPNQYRLDGEWRDFEKSTARIPVKLWGPFWWTFERDILRSVHGPVMQSEHGFYAFRFGGQNEIRQVEQWYAMNRARDFESWYEAMLQHRFASFNFVFADKTGNIAFIHNSLTPQRIPGYDWSQYLSGDDSNLIWKDYIDFRALPQVINPSQGYVTSANQTPFNVAHPLDNPNPENFASTDGYQTRMTNRAVRSLELFEALSPISEADFWAIKHDKAYSPNSRAGQYIQAALNADLSQSEPLYQEAQRLLSQWDLVADIESEEAALGVCLIRAEWKAEQHAKSAPASAESLIECADQLMRVSGRLNPPWGEINRHIRGAVNVPVGGGPDTLRAIYGTGYEENGYLKNTAGDGLYYLVRWDKNESLSVQGVHHYGAATMLPASPHFDDQAADFAQERTHVPLFKGAAREAAGSVRRYRP